MCGEVLRPVPDFYRNMYGPDPDSDGMRGSVPYVQGATGPDLGTVVLESGTVLFEGEPVSRVRGPINVHLYPRHVSGGHGGSE